MPVIDLPFTRIVMDVIGLLPRSSAGNQYILVFMDYATRYPDVVPLRTVMVPRIAEELIKWIAQVGIPQEILANQGCNFVRGAKGGVPHVKNKTTLYIGISSTNKWIGRKT